MQIVKKWLCTLNVDPVWQDTVNKASTYEELECIVQPIVSEIGWLNLQELAEIIKEVECEILEDRNKSREGK
jgi:hypothetical protein